MKQIEIIQHNGCCEKQKEMLVTGFFELYEWGDWFSDSLPYTNCISWLFGFLLQDPLPSSLCERPSPRPLSLSFLVLHGSCDIHTELCFQGIYEQLHGTDTHIYLLLQNPLSDSSNYSLTVSFFEAGSVAATSPSWRRLPLLSPCSSGPSSRRGGLFLIR